jgi:hypothetical protein
MKFNPENIPLKVYIISAFPSLLCGCEILTLKQMALRRLKTAEMKFMTCAEGCNLLYHRRRKEILEELTVDPDEKKVAQYKQKY